VVVREYIRADDRCPFRRWFISLNPPARAKVAIALTRIENGNFSNVKSVGSGILEFRIDYGPGYRIYFGRDGERLVILLGGGSKQGQQRDIAAANVLWQEYRMRK
jgi:putative addiction module killer protein